MNKCLSTWGTNVFAIGGDGGVYQCNLVDIPNNNNITKVDGVTNVAGLAIGALSFGALTLDKKLYTWGNSGDGRLGIGDRKPFPDKMNLVDIPPIDAISFGAHHCIALTENKQVFTWGWGDSGRLGHGDRQSSNSPKRVAFFDSLPDEVVLIGAGGGHTMAVTVGGDVYSWGYPDSGRLGLNNNADIYHVPTKVDILCKKGVKVLALGGAHTIALTENGDIYGWGSSRCGQLALETTEDVLRPTLIPFFKHNKINCVTVAAGEYHSLALTDNGEIYAFGSNGSGQLGYKTNPRAHSSVHIPQKIPEIGMIIAIGAGKNFSVGITEQLHLWVWKTISGSSRHFFPQMQFLPWGTHFFAAPSTDSTSILLNWKKLRLIWIAFFRNENNSCILGTLPRELLWLIQEHIALQH